MTCFNKTDIVLQFRSFVEPEPELEPVKVDKSRERLRKA